MTFEKIHKGAINWEAPLTNAKGIFGPSPWRMGSWDDSGELVSCRDMTKREELEQLFESTSFNHEEFRAWLAKVNPNSLHRLNLWAAQWDNCRNACRPCGLCSTDDEKHGCPF